MESNSNNNHNDRFETTDIALATMLKVSGIELIDIYPVDLYTSTFVFHTPPQELFATWLSGRAQAEVRETINVYRHLVRESKIEQSRRFRGVR